MYKLLHQKTMFNFLIKIITFLRKFRKLDKKIKVKLNSNHNNSFSSSNSSINNSNNSKTCYKI